MKKYKVTLVTTDQKFIAELDIKADQFESYDCEIV